MSHGGIWDRSAFPMAEVPGTESKMLRYGSDREQAAGRQGLGAGCLRFGMQTPVGAQVDDNCPSEPLRSAIKILSNCSM